MSSAREPLALADLHEREIPPLLDADQVAIWLRLAGGRQALEMARRRLLPSVKIGKHVLFLRDGVLRALAGAEIPAISDEELNE